MTEDATGGLMQLATAYGEAWNDADASAILALHAEDSVFQLHNGSPAAIGIGAVAVALRDFFDQWSSVKFVRRSIFFGKESWAVEWTFTAKPRGAGGSDVDGKTVSFEGVDVVTARAGRVTAKHVYYDATTASKMLGIVMR